MFIQSIHLKNFKGFQDATIRFPDDITVIKGPNERGKSTLLEALGVVLFADPTKPRAAYEDFRSWGSPDNLFSIGLVFEHEGETYELLKDFEKKTVTLVNRDRGVKYDTFKEVQELLANLGGYRNQVLFQNTAFVREESIEIVTKSKKAIDSAIEDVLTGGTSARSVGEVMKKVERTIAELTRGLGSHPVKNPGRIAHLQSELERIKGLVRGAEDEAARFDEKSRMLLDLEKKLSQKIEEEEVLARELAEDDAFFKFIERKSRLLKELSDVERTVEELEKVDGEVAKIEEARGRLGIFSAWKAKDLEQEIHTLEQEEHELEIFSNDIRHLARSMERPNMFSHPLIVSLFIFLGIGGIGGFFLHRLFFLNWGIFAGLAIGLFVFRLSLGDTARGKARRRKELKEKKSAHALTRNNFSRALAKYGVGSIEDLRKILDKLRLVEREYENAIQRKEGILAGRPETYFKEKKQEIARTIALEEAKIPQRLFAKPPTTTEYHRASKRADALRKEREILQQETAGLRAIVGELAECRDTLLTLEEEARDLNAELLDAKEELEVFTVLKENLEEARGLSFKKVRDVLAGEMGRMLDDLTGGRYVRVGLDEELKFTVFSGEKGDWVEPEEHLSRGTIDQFYLVARFALLKILTVPTQKEGKTVHARPLIILDDPFGSFDASRRSNARDLIKKMSTEFQIILLTHSDLFDEWGHVTEL